MLEFETIVTIFVNVDNSHFQLFQLSYYTYFQTIIIVVVLYSLDTF